MRIAIFRSMEMQRDRGEGTSGDFGFYEHECDLDEAMIKISGDPKGFIIRHLAHTAAGLVEAHGIPIFLWTAYIDPKVRGLTNLPEKVDFK